MSRAGLGIGAEGMNPDVRQAKRIADLERRLRQQESSLGKTEQKAYSEYLPSKGFAAINTFYNDNQPSCTVNVQAGDLVSVFFMWDYTTVNTQSTPFAAVLHTSGGTRMLDMFLQTRAGAGTTTGGTTPGSTTGVSIIGPGTGIPGGGFHTFRYNGAAGDVTFEMRRWVGTSLAGTPTVANQRLWVEVR